MVHGQLTSVGNVQLHNPILIRRKSCEMNLMLLDVDVGDVEPDVAEVGRGFADFGEDDSGLVGVALVGQHAADAVRRPDVLRIVSQHLQAKGMF